MHADDEKGKYPNVQDAKMQKYKKGLSKYVLKKMQNTRTRVVTFEVYLVPYLYRHRHLQLSSLPMPLYDPAPKIHCLARMQN